MGRKKQKAISLDDPRFLNVSSIKLTDLGLNLYPGKRHQFPNISGYELDYAWAIKQHKRRLRFHEEMKDVGNIQTLYHGCTKNIEAMRSILKDGLKPGSSGMFGAAIYVGPKAKAANFVKNKVGFLVKVLVALGKEYHAPRSIGDMDKKKLAALGYDCVKGVAGETKGWTRPINYDEWAIYYPERVLVVGVARYKKKVKPENDTVSSFFMNNSAATPTWTVGGNISSSGSSASSLSFYFQDSGNNLTLQDGNAIIRTGPRKRKKSLFKERKKGRELPTKEREKVYCVRCRRELQPRVDKLRKIRSVVSFMMHIICSVCGTSSGVISEPMIKAWRAETIDIKPKKKKTKKKGRRRK